MKKWYESKTMWVNILSTIAIIAQAVTGHEVISVEVQGLFLTGINMVLRIVTKSEVTFK